MRVLRIAVVCCLISMFAVLPIKTKSAESGGRCAIPNRQAAFADSEAVFVGEVLSVVKDGDVKTFTFKVEKYWKGSVRKKIEVSVHENPRYQAWFEVGEKYLVYARGGGTDKKLREVRCSRTKSLADASEDISKLGRAKKAF